jgi:hypothetical protein
MAPDCRARQRRAAAHALRFAIQQHEAARFGGMPASAPVHAPPPTDIPLRLLADGQPLAGRVCRLTLRQWWHLVLRQGAQLPGRTGVWLYLRGPVPLRGRMELVFLARNGTILRIERDRPRGLLVRRRGARQVLVLRPGMAARWGLQPGMGLDLLA